MSIMLNTDKIISRRKSLKISQDAVAKLVSEAMGTRLSQQGYQKIEAGGSPNSSAIPFICAVLGLSYEDISGRENPLKAADGKTLYNMLKSLPEDEQAVFLKLLAVDAYKE